MTTDVMCFYAFRSGRSTYSVVQDVLVVTAPGSGAEVIPFLKTWVNLPMAIGFTVLYAKVEFIPVQQVDKLSNCTS